jgi:hypothetical protein
MFVLLHKDGKFCAMVARGGGSVRFALRMEHVPGPYRLKFGA